MDALTYVIINLATLAILVMAGIYYGNWQYQLGKWDGIVETEDRNGIGVDNNNGVPMVEEGTTNE